MSIFAELKRRNVFKVALVYSAVAWLLLQVSDTLGPALHLPEWFISAVAFLLILGFPIAVVFAWAFELTPHGLRAETKVDPDATEAVKNDKALYPIVIVVLVLSLGYFVFDKFVLGSNEGPADTVAADQTQPVEPAPSEAEPSIAVLPFVNMSSDEEQEYFSNGLSEELLNLLARIPELNVAARTSSFAFKDQGIGIPEIASQLSVAHVLEGSVRKEGDQIRITVQLIQADNGYHLWSETYDRQLDNVFQIQDEIASAVVGALRVTLLGDAPKTRKTDPVAYQLFLEGQYLKRLLSTDSLNSAVDVFKRAVEIDPLYAPAWAELSDTYLWGGGRDKLSVAERRALGAQAAQTAIDVDPDYGFGYYARGISHIFGQGISGRANLKRGLEDFQKALELDPNNAFLVAAIGKGAIVAGNLDLAIVQYEAALDMEPFVPEFHFYLGSAYLSIGRLDEAEAMFRKLVGWGSYPGIANRLWMTLWAKGEYEEALAETNSLVARAVLHHAMGNAEEADEALHSLIEGGNSQSIAVTYARRGNVDKAFEWFNRMLENDDHFSVFILTDVGNQSMHSDPRWEPFLEELGILEYWLARTPNRSAG